MSQQQIPKHQLLPEEFLILERIEQVDASAFEGLHRHDFYEVLWFTDVKDNENHQIDFENYLIQPGQLYILSPNQVHTMKTGTKKGYLLAFPKTLFTETELPATLFKKPYFFSLHPDSETKSALRVLINLMETEYSGQRRKSLLYAYCKVFFIHITSVQGNIPPSNPDKTATLLRLIAENYVSQKEVAFYARELNTSERRLNEICVKYTGETVKQLIIDRTITEAKRFIGSGNLSVKEIAYQLGFTDPAYFSRIFKSKTDFTPEEFRRKQTTFK